MGRCSVPNEEGIFWWGNRDFGNGRLSDVASTRLRLDVQIKCCSV